MYKVVLLSLFLVFSSVAKSQTHPASTVYRNFPLILSLQFHNLSSPLKDLKSNFLHPGVGLGTEIGLGSSGTWVQQFQLVWYSNRKAGNGFLIYTQSAYRPTIAFHVYTEVKAGFGFTWQQNPGAGWQSENAAWSSAGHTGKWMFTFPVGVSLGYNEYSQKTYVSPFASYQVLLNSSYAQGIPLMTNSLFQAGSAIHYFNTRKPK